MAPGTALAQGANDGDVEAIIDGIMAAEVQQGKYTEAEEKLEVAKFVCEGNACSDRVIAKLAVAIGIVRVRKGNAESGKKSFRTALTSYPKTVLIPAGVTKEVRQAFVETIQSIEDEKSAGCIGKYKKQRPGRGWRSGEAYFCYKEAYRFANKRSYEACLGDVRASLGKEDRVGSRFLLGRCLEGTNKYLEAIATYTEVANKGRKTRQYRLSAQGRARARQLQLRMPRLILQIPTNAKDITVKVDGTPYETSQVKKGVRLDPGPHDVSVEGTVDGDKITFDQQVELKPGRTANMAVRLDPAGPKWATKKQLDCMKTAKSADDFAKCLGKAVVRDAVGGPTDLTTNVGVEVSGYTDDMDVNILTPSVHVQVEDVTAGWGFGASFLVDMVSAASVDIVATASPHFQEVRWAPSLNGHVRFGDVDIALAGNLSHEPDYIATGIGATVAVDFLQKNVTPAIGYQYSHDINGRVDTPFSEFSRLIDRHAFDLSLGLVLDKATFMNVGGTAVIENGDTSKPYRHIPLFDPAQAPGVPNGLVIDAVNFFRLPERPLEQLPTDRQRFAIAGFLAHRFSNATLRVSERLYADSWGVMATTTDARYMIDVAKPVRIWPHARFHGQTGADFYQLVYAAAVDQDTNTLVIPAIRAGDRELGPLYSITAGAGAHFSLDDDKTYGLTVQGDFLYSRFLEHLYVKERFAGFGAVIFEAEFR